VTGENVGDPAYLVAEFLVGDVPIDSGFVADPDDRGLVRLVLDVPVDAVVAGVELPTQVPPEIHLVKTRLLYRIPLLKPVEGLGLLGPEGVRVLDGLAVHPLVVLDTLDMGLAGDIGLDGDEIGNHFGHSGILRKRAGRTGAQSAVETPG
jgi:hypothetical protein